MSVRLSNRQYPVVRSFTALGDRYMSIAEAQRFDQRAFRSLWIRKYISYRPGRGFHLTKEGWDAVQIFETTDPWRKNPMLPLFSLFDPTAYGLPARKSLHVVKGKVA